MRKHSAPVSTGTSMKRGKTGPGGMGYSMKQVSDTCTRITGRAYVGEVNTNGKMAANVKQNALGLIFDINPSLLNDRVAVISSTFQKYVYQRVKFTYVPQCSTAISGSVGLVFDRDPLMISANTQGTQFLSEVMSYEHATLTPAYVEASASYSRDPKELKTWFLGAPDATLTTRETSQGNLLCYLSNAQRDVGYGFIVMDYVLDLIAPTLLPSKQGITDIRKAPSQWVDISPSGCTTDSTVGVPSGSLINGTSYFPYYTPPAWETSFTGDVAGAVGEIQLGNYSAQSPAYPGTACVFGGATIKCVNADGIVLASGKNDSFGAATVGESCFAFGQKLYFAIHGRTNASGAPSRVYSFHTTLSSARAAAGQYVETSATAAVARVLPDQVLCNQGGGIVIGGWARLIAEGCGSEDTA